MEIVPHQIDPAGTCVVLFDVTGYPPGSTFSPVYNAYKVIDGSPELWTTFAHEGGLQVAADGTGSWGSNVVNNQHDAFGNVVVTEFILGPLTWGPEHVSCGSSEPTPTPVPPTATPLPPTPTPVPKTQSLVIEPIATNPDACLMTASIAGYVPDSRIPVVKVTWQFQTDHWEDILVSTTIIVVESDGTGSVTLVVGNQAGRDDLRTDLFIDGVTFIDFTQLTC